MITWLSHRITPHRETKFEGWFGVGPVWDSGPGSKVVGVSIAFGHRRIAFHRKMT